METETHEWEMVGYVDRKGRLQRVRRREEDGRPRVRALDASGGKEKSIHSL